MAFEFLRKVLSSSKGSLKSGQKEAKRPCSRSSQTLYDRLLSTPEKFSFVKAMDVAIKICGIERISLKSNINFSSKYTEISNIEGLKDGIAEIMVNIGGIAGIEGSLPDCYVEEYITFNDRKSRAELMDFLDIFNERFLLLKYKYMKRQKIESLSSPIGKTVIGNIIFSLSGFDFDEKEIVSSEESTHFPMIPEQFRISTQNLFWRHTRSASGLSSIISSFFKVPVEIKQFIGGFIELSSREEQLSIGNRLGRFNILGQETFLGNKVWDATKGIEVRIGPLSYEEYSKFLPKQSRLDQKFSPLEKMKEIIKEYVPSGLDVNIHFFLDECLVSQTFLNGSNRLNKNAFIFGIHTTKSAYFNERL